MNLTPVSLKDIPRLNSYAKTKNMVLLEEFIASGESCSEVHGWKHKSAEVASCSLRASIKKFRLGIQVTVRNNRVFLIRKEALA